MKPHTLLILSTFASPSVQSFLHPGLLVTDADLDRASSKIAQDHAPWNTSYSALVDCACADASYAPQAVATIYRGSDGVHTPNVQLLWEDAAAAFALALRWKLSGNDTYADTAANILRAWGSTLTAIGGDDDAYLAAGFQGHELANAGELLRDYEPFATDGLAEFQSMMTSVFLTMNLRFLNHKVSSEHNVVHFFANWEMGNLASAMAIAVLTDNTTVWDFGVNYFKSGVGNGCINRAVSNLVTDPDSGAVLGQGQESGRDQGHSALDWEIIAVVAQQAWNQGEDLFSYNNSRVLQGAEYFARYNLGNEVPFKPYTNSIVYYTEISNSSRGTVRPTWELLHSHYVQIKGMDAPWTTAYLNNSLNYFGGFEPGAGAFGSSLDSGNYDSLGWGSLLYHRDDNDTISSSSSFNSSTVSNTSLPVSVTSSQGSLVPTVTTRPAVPTKLPGCRRSAKLG